jgi:hypothetical protein
MKISSIAFVLGSAAVTTLPAQGVINAQLVANTQLEATWLNAPPNTPGASMSQAPGLFSACSLQVSQGGTASYYANFGASGANWSMNTGCYSWPGTGNLMRVAGDISLLLTAPPTVTADISVRLSSGGDGAGSNAIFVQLNGSPIVGYFHGFNVMQRAVTWDFAAGPADIGAVVSNVFAQYPQGLSASVSVRPWADGATDLGDPCGLSGVDGDAHVWAHLAALRPTTPQSIAHLEATGLGQFAAFLISDQPTTSPTLPNGIVLSCPILSSIIATVPGVVTGVSTPRPWVTEVPTLPPGLEFYVQHACMTLPTSWNPRNLANLGLTLSNRVRIRT